MSWKRLTETSIPSANKQYAKYSNRSCRGLNLVGRRGYHKTINSNRKYTELLLIALATWCKEPTHWKRPWFWERLKTREEGNRGWDGWMPSLTKWTWVWALGNSEGQGSLACCGPWGRKESDLTWLSDWTTTKMLITGASSMLSKHILTWGWSGASVKLGFEMGKEEWNRKYIRGGVGCGLGASGRRHSSLKYSEQKGRRYTWKLLVSWV